MEKFYIGLDVGTDSVGIACTDEEYKLLRAKGNDLWAVRLFEEAQTAEKRRLKRTARRRLQRRAMRIDLLQELLEPYIADKLFFPRLNNSGFIYEDKDSRLASPYSLFADKDYNDRFFYKEFPTIFHLRKALIDGAEKYDLRLYYLALHHIIKYRGHFLFEGQSINEIHDLRELLKELNRAAEYCFDEDVPVISEEKADEFKAIATDKFLRLNDKKKKCCNLLNAAKSPLKDIVAAMIGSSVKPYDIFGVEEYKSEKSISFKGLSDDEFAALEETYGENFAYLQAIKKVYDYIVFEQTLDGCAYISESMIKIYDKHASDLRRLKTFIARNFSHDVYLKVFKSTKEKNNYAAYIGYTKVGKKKVDLPKCKDKAEFDKFLKHIIGEAKTDNDEEKASLLSEIENGDFLPKILNADNGKFPYQINGAELGRILDNLCRDYPEFSAQGEDGLSISEKIESIFKFRIPYYVGPLSTFHSGGGKGNSWVCRKSEGKIYPWNFDEKIDKAASNERFMRRMTNKCTYLYNENTLPRHSIIYQKFDTLNQLNNLKIDERPISVELKQDIYNDLFLKHKSVKNNMIKKYLADKGLVPKSHESEISISGFDGEIKASMSSYITLKKILGDIVDTDTEICENIILWHTLNTDKNIVEKLIISNYGNIPQIRDNIKSLKGISSFKDFGKLSKRFLCELKGADRETGVVTSIMSMLYDTNLNLNRILWDRRYTFMETIDAENGEDSDEIAYDTLEEMGLNPQVRRGVWQALKMTDEYINAVGRAPDKIFVEVTRSDGEKGKRTQSRKNKIEKLYETARDVDKLLQELKTKSDSELRQERLYLYFMQLGKCAYSGREITLDALNGNTYDVDHILPQSLVKDDSIDNKVLVYRECNAKKTNIYPVPEQFRRMRYFWDRLKSQGLMSAKKYALLTRTEPLADEDYRDFVNRQIVVTGQTAKAVAELLKRKYESQGTKIVYSKGTNVSDFKNKYDIVKCRETNDLHHARDAYFNIVVGNVYDTKFSGTWFKSGKDYGQYRNYDRTKIFDAEIAGAWNGEKTIAKVKATAEKCSMKVTHYAYTGKGEFYNETVYGKDEGAQLPRKEGKAGKPSPYADVSKYGGYKGVSTAYFVVVQSLGKKGITIKTIEAIPVIVDYKSKNDPNAVMNYLCKDCCLKEPKIIIDKIKIKTLLEVNGTPVCIAGAEKGRILMHNAVQWYTSPEIDSYVKGLFKLEKMDKEKMIEKEERDSKEFKISTNRFDERKCIIDAQNNLKLYGEIIKSLEKKIYNGISQINDFRKNLQKRREEFITLSTIDQVKVLSQCIKFMKCNSENADLSLLGESKNSGRIRISKNIDKKNITIVHTSECGLIERRVKI